MKIYNVDSILKIIFIALVFMLFFWTTFPAIAQNQVIPDSIFCPQCRVLNPATARFCSNCGYKFAGLPEKKDTLQVKEEKPATTAESPSPQPELTTEQTKADSPAPAEEPSANELKAKAYYDTGIAMFEKGLYPNAVVLFEKIIKEYPNSKYAEVAPVMIRACLTMKAAAEEQNNAKKSGGGSSFGAGFLGGLVGVLVLVLLLVSAAD